MHLNKELFLKCVTKSNMTSKMKKIKIHYWNGIIVIIFQTACFSINAHSVITNKSIIIKKSNKNNFVIMINNIMN